MGQAVRKTDAHYTYGEYRHWPPDERWELINGTAWSMSPAPSRAHQAVLGRLHLIFGNWLKDKPCRVYLAPVDVLLPADPAGSVQIYRLNNKGRYDDPEILVKTGSAASAVFEGFQVDLEAVFAL